MSEKRNEISKNKMIILYIYMHTYIYNINQEKKFINKSLIKY